MLFLSGGVPAISIFECWQFGWMASIVGIQSRRGWGVQMRRLISLLSFSTRKMDVTTRHHTLDDF